jgi:hypothetical protein
MHPRPSRRVQAILWSGREFVLGRQPADLLLFDPATVGISPPRRVNDLPARRRRSIRRCRCAI